MTIIELLQTRDKYELRSTTQDRCGVLCGEAYYEVSWLTVVYGQSIACQLHGGKAATMSALPIIVSPTSSSVGLFTH